MKSDTTVCNEAEANALWSKIKSHFEGTSENPSDCIRIEVNGYATLVKLEDVSYLSFLYDEE